MMRRATTLIVLFLLAVGSQPARAAYCCAVLKAVEAGLKILNATASRIEGNTSEIESNTGEIVDINQSIDGHVVDATNDIVRAVNANTQSRIRELEALGHTIVSALQAHATALGVMEAQRQFGGAGVVEIGGKKYLTDAHSPNVCSDAKRARAMAEGVVAARVVERQGTIRAKQHNRAFASHRSATRRLAQLKPEQFEADKLMADGITLTEEQVADLQEAIINLTNPEPLPEIGEEQATTDTGKEYRAMKRIHDARRNLAQAALNHQLALRAPTVETDQGKVSIMQAFLDSDIAKRYFNAIYAGKLETKTSHGRINEIASLMTARLFLQYQRWVTKQQLLTLLTAAASSQLRRERQDLERLYVKAKHR